MANENIFEIGKNVLVSNVGNRKSIYKVEIFDGKTQIEKKHFRTKLRRELSKYLGTFLQVKNNPEKLKQLKITWDKYAKQVYTDINIICDNNTDIDTKKLCNEFLTTLSKIK